MAQTLFYNVTSDRVTVADRQSHTHQVARGSSASGDLTVSIDTTNIKSWTQVLGIFDRVIQILKGDSNFKAM